MNNGHINLPFVSVIILNYNTKIFLEKYIKSVINSNYPKDKTEIIFIDSNSAGDSVEYAKRLFGSIPIIKIIALNKNYGFARGNNIAIKFTNKKSKSD